MIIQHATIINEGERFTGSLLIREGRIACISHDQEIHLEGEEEMEAQGCLLLPGIIDEHVHMRDPGLTAKGDMETETRAAAAGGVTTVLDMPNVVPQTTTLSLLEERYRIGAEKCHVNYAFYLGATNDNLDEILHADPHRTPAIKLFMGSSTGNMLVDDDNQLRRIFQHVPLPIMTHCEDTTRINRRMAQAKERYGPDPAVEHHPEIRDAEACFLSTELAVRLARETGARLHVAHISTARELALFQPNDDQITAEACVPHLLYSDADYPRLGSLIKCNPAIKTDADREALRGALSDGRIRCVATDHAPHLPSEKEGGACRAMSGMPMVQFSLVSMLQLVDERVLTLERMVQLMCHHPAELFQISQRGFIREGYWADLVLVRRNESPWKLVPECIQSRCGWSPRMGDLFHWSVLSTWVNGCRVWDGKQVDVRVHGAPVLFRR